MKQAICSETLSKMLMDAGVMPDNCRRMIIDVQMGNAVIIYTELYGDERLLDLNWAEGLKPEIKERDRIMPDESVEPLEPDIVTEVAKYRKGNRQED